MWEAWNILCPVRPLAVSNRCVGDKEQIVIIIIKKVIKSASDTLEYVNCQETIKFLNILLIYLYQQ